MAAPAACLDVLCAAGLFGCRCQLPLRLPMPLLMPMPAPKNKSSPQAGSRGPRAEGGRELLPSPSRTYPEAWWLRALLASVLQAASLAFLKIALPH